MVNPNLDLLIAMVRAMGPLCEQVVFVGGCATGLLVDNAELMDVRPTEDVDAIVEVASLAAYHRLAEGLMERGFKQTMAENTPPFRWYWNRMQLDLIERPMNTTTHAFDQKLWNDCKVLRDDVVRYGGGLCGAADLPVVPQHGGRTRAAARPPIPPTCHKASIQPAR